MTWIRNDKFAPNDDLPVRLNSNGLDCGWKVWRRESCVHCKGAREPNKTRMSHPVNRGEVSSQKNLAVWLDSYGVDRSVQSNVNVALPGPIGENPAEA